MLIRATGAWYITVEKQADASAVEGRDQKFRRESLGTDPVSDELRYSYMMEDHGRRVHREYNLAEMTIEDTGSACIWLLRRLYISKTTSAPREFLV